ncbi:DNA/RNA-binding protein kin17 [Chamberlinius hualienensis]
MGKKHEPMTPKAIANRIKAKGLQKLRWYCQMCQKQCRDENGFKCHTMSESHQRQLLLFADCPGKYLGSFSGEFQTSFMDLLRRRFGTRRVQANVVYQEYIHDRNHLHMNATKWLTLTGFVQHLGRTGLCKVEQTEKGWFITYIDRDPETLRRQEALATKVKMDKDDEERIADFVAQQVERANEQKQVEEIEYTELKRENEDEKVVFALPVGVAPRKEKKLAASEISNPLMEEEEKPKVRKRESDEKDTKANKKSKRGIEDLIKEDEERKEAKNRKDYWLQKGIVVKIITKDLGEKYYKMKGVVEEVVDRFAAKVKLIDSKIVVKLDQVHLETVIPAIGKQVRILNGAYRDESAELVSLNEKKFCCTVKIDCGPLRGRIVEGIKYEDLSKVY